MGNIKDRVGDRDWDVNVCTVQCVLLVNFENLIWGHLAGLPGGICNS